MGPVTSLLGYNRVHQCPQKLSEPPSLSSSPETPHGLSGHSCHGGAPKIPAKLQASMSPVVPVTPQPSLPEPCSRLSQVSFPTCSSLSQLFQQHTLYFTLNPIPRQSLADAKSTLMRLFHLEEAVRNTFWTSGLKAVSAMATFKVHMATLSL